MKATELKVGQRVLDTWFPEWGTAKVVKVLKTRVYLDFGTNVLVYDKGHFQFLKKVN
jgi:hypothetical protein